MDKEYAPLVSIVLPTYNGEKYVRETIQSLVSQTYKNIELVISDDGSTDSTPDIIREYAAKYPFIKINLSPKNLGIAANYNLAVKMASGEIAIGIGHDDLLPPEHTSAIVPYFKDPRVGLVHCNAMRIDSKGRHIKFVARDAEKIKKTKDPMRWLCFNNFVQSCGMAYRRKAFIDIGGWDDAFSYDSEWYTYIRYAEKYKFVYTTDTFSFYRVHDTNISKMLKGAKSREFEAYRQRCREMALARSNLGLFDSFRVKAKIWRKEIKRKLKGALNT